jgi:hypothetical protein
VPSDGHRLVAIFPTLRQILIVELAFRLSPSTQRELVSCPRLPNWIQRHVTFRRKPWRRGWARR